MAWDSKSGTLNTTTLSDDEYWSLFNYVYVGGAKKTSTYKFALIKAILDNLLNNIPTVNGQEILYSNIFTKFSESYWNLVVKYNLHQQAPTKEGKTSKIEQIFKEAVAINPILQNIDFASIEKSTQNRLVSKVQTECKKYVLGALHSDFNSAIYGFSECSDRITLSHGAYEFCLRHKMELEKLNYYAWAKFLESINEEKLLYKIILKIETSLPERKPLDIYRKILFEEFEQNNCFYCGKKLSSTIIHVDHFIPWSFVKEDKLWNFVLSCPDCNIKKSDKLPSKNFISIIRNRNNLILNTLSSNLFIKQQFTNYKQDLISNLWQYAFYSGFKLLNHHQQIQYHIDPHFGELNVADSGFDYSSKTEGNI